MPLVQDFEVNVRACKGKIDEGTLNDIIAIVKSCHKAWRDSANKPQGCQHVELWFQNQLNETTGNNIDRENHKRPWGCPLGHYRDQAAAPVLSRLGPSQPR